MAAGPGTRPEPPRAAAGAPLHAQVTPHTPRWASHTAGGSFRLPPFQGRVGEHQDPPTPSPPRRDSRGGQGMGQGCSARTHTSPFPPNWSQSRQTRGKSHGVGVVPPSTGDNPRRTPPAHGNQGEGTAGEELNPLELREGEEKAEGKAAPAGRDKARCRSQEMKARMR